MPIQVSSNSCCDVCLDAFRGPTGSIKAPHSIPCGHVFCKRSVALSPFLTSLLTTTRSCLMGIPRPPICPLCRRTFRPDDIRRLYISASSDASIALEDAAQLDFMSRALRAADAGTAEAWIPLAYEIENAERMGRVCYPFESPSPGVDVQMSRT